MIDTLLPYYERELRFFRTLAHDFSRRYPREGRLLGIEANRSTDPHVERLIEAFSLIAARIHARIDDDFPELTDALLGVLYPHYLAPVPSMAIIQFRLNPGAAQSPEGLTIESGSRLDSLPVRYKDRDLACQFRTTYPVTLWPVAVTDASLQVAPFQPAFPAALQPPPGTQAALRLRLEYEGDLPLAELQMDRLRFYLDGDSQLVAALYELIFNHSTKVALAHFGGGRKSAPVWLEPKDCLTQVGFDADEGVLPYPSHAFPGYRLLTEFFAFPHKFAFVDVSGWKRLGDWASGKEVELVIYLNEKPDVIHQNGTSARNFRLGCTPIVNLFQQVAEGITLSQTRHEYQVVPDRSFLLGKEVYAIEEVTSSDPIADQTTTYQPFFSFHHGQSADGPQAFWYASRRPSSADRGTEIWLTLVDQSFNPRVPSDPTLMVRTLCTNRDLPVELHRYGEDAFQLTGAQPVKVLCVRAPSETLRPPLRRGHYWRVVSHLSLNHLSISDPGEGRFALQEILRLYDFSGSGVGQELAEANRQMIEGIVGISSQRVVRRIGSPADSAFCRGIEVQMEFDPEKYLGTSVLLFASVLERFLGLYASINSFTQLVARKKKKEGYLKRWPPRAGELPLI